MQGNILIRIGNQFRITDTNTVFTSLRFNGQTFQPGNTTSLHTIQSFHPLCLQNPSTDFRHFQRHCPLFGSLPFHPILLPQQCIQIRSHFRKRSLTRLNLVHDMSNFIIHHHRFIKRTQRRIPTTRLQIHIETNIL